MAKRRKVLNFHLWLNVAMENVFLGNLSLFVSVILLSKLCLEQVHKPTGEWAEQKGEGEGEQILRLPGLSQSKGNGNV